MLQVDHTLFYSYILYNRNIPLLNLIKQNISSTFTNDRSFHE